MRLKFITSIVSILLIAVTVGGCGNKLKSEKVESPSGYDFNNPKKFRMREGLLEISGIAFHNNNPDTVYAIEDEDGRVYHFHPGDSKVAYTHFSKQGDYEDVTIINDNVIVLKSSGTLYSFPIANINLEDQTNVKEFKKLLPKAEYEGLYADQADKKIYVLCKDCGGKKAGELDGGYILSAANPDTLVQSGTFSITMEKLMKKNGDEDKFKPSALGKNPVSGDWFILSANNNMLLVTDGKFIAKGSYKLLTSRFLQPEGIAFDSKGNLYISNEGDELESGNILRFEYKPSAKK
ncbi:SdiA-regulated family protein [Mucilaginibacter achroorhodeus]|uniref:SdiA-regulated family protein n=1 Tax=Mucilaginibacter achroorhodeus TaxID=2599294 RepID=A0A563U1L2_9SPHI|nr:SdiA-regulated domain-containing protein [Mucilaginibacter achroorhodeus]TWR25507.1 SdiA-regulated family protein [Mucilaginibacter achroorhodeus]